MRCLRRMMATVSTASSTSSSSAPRVAIPKNGVDYRNTIVLAPMVRSGELPTRLLALKYGADLVWGPETIDRALIGCTASRNPHTDTLEFKRYPSNASGHPQKAHVPSIIFKIHPSETRRLIYQIGTATPSLAVEAAKLVAPHVAGIDVNSGCPKPFSTSGGMGAALLRNPDNLCAILRALVEEVGKPFEIGISVKIRILNPPEDTSSLVERLCQTGITGLTIHCRTPPMRPRERAIRDQLRNLAAICHKHGVAVLMNGDVESRTAAKDLTTEFGVDGAMIATAAEKNASVFLPEGPRPWKEVTMEYFKFALDTDNKWGNTKFMLAHIIHTKSPIKQTLSKAKGYVDVAKLLGAEDLLAKAMEVDQRLRLSQDADHFDTDKENSTIASTQAHTSSKKREALENAELDIRNTKMPRVDSDLVLQATVGQ